MSRPLSFYLNLVTSQYRNSPKFLELMEALLQKLEDLSALSDGIDSAFDIDQAAGVQLDILGKIVGRERTVDFIPSYDFSPTLNDDDYRLLLKAKIGINQWDGLQSSLGPLWARLFPAGKIGSYDNQDMTMDIYASGPDLPSMAVDLIRHGYIVPRPQAVLVNYYIGDLPFLGFDYDNDFISGPDKGHWWTPLVDTYPMFGFDRQDSYICGFGPGLWYTPA